MSHTKKTTGRYSSANAKTADSRFDSDQEGSKSVGNNDDSNQQGDDPATEHMEDRKLTGTGASGSHSAFFGLTLDGRKDEHTSSTTTAPEVSNSGKKEQKEKGSSNDDSWEGI